MGLFDGIIGNASEISTEEVMKECSHLLTTKEDVYKGYKLVRDLIIFTNKRLLLIDKQGVTGKKIEYMSIPYNKIHRFAVETAGHMDLDAELKIWLSGEQFPIKKQFNRNTNIYEVQKILADFCL